MKTIIMKNDQNGMTHKPVENEQQSDIVSRAVASRLAEVQSKIKIAADQRPPHYGTEPVKLVAVSKRQPDVKIDAALRRIDDGTYGYCEESGEPISLKRLDARPIATLSVEAQERHERRERDHRDD